MEEHEKLDINEIVKWDTRDTKQHRISSKKFADKIPERIAFCKVADIWNCSCKDEV